MVSLVRAVGTSWYVRRRLPGLRIGAPSPPVGVATLELGLFSTSLEPCLSHIRVFVGQLTCTRITRMESNVKCVRPASISYCLLADLEDVSLVCALWFKLQVQAYLMSDEAAPMSDDVQAAIHTRSKQLERHGKYWGWSDWIAWGWSAQTRVHMILGDGCNHIFEAFCHPDVHRASLDWSSDLYVVACRCSGNVDGTSWANVNHFVHATPLREIPAVAHTACNSSLEHKLDAMLTVASSSDVNAEIFEAYFDRDWAVTFTVTDGNCACDTIAIHTGSPRTAPTFAEIRARTAVMMRTLAVEDWFRHAFCLAQEHTPRTADPVVPVADPPSSIDLTTCAVDGDAGADGPLPSDGGIPPALLVAGARLRLPSVTRTNRAVRAIRAVRAVLMVKAVALVVAALSQMHAALRLTLLF